MQETVYNQNAWILNYQPKIEHQHIHTNSQSDNNVGEPDEDFEYVNLEFFDKSLFGTYERQVALRKVLKEAFKRMMLDTGRDMVAVYIAYHFLKDQLLNLKEYTDFFQDIEGLMPNVLPKIKEEETSRSQRYKSISKIKPRKRLLIKYKGHSFFCYVDKMHG